MPGVTTAAARPEHELYVWNAKELIENLKKVKEDVHRGVEMNDWLKGTIDADIIALAQLTQAGTKVAQQIRLLGIVGRAYIKEVNGTKYIIFKGNAKLRPNLKGTRYLAENAKVRCFVVGSKDLLKDAAHGVKIAVIAFVVIDIVAELSSDQPSLASLGVHVSSDVLQAVVASAAGWAAGALILAVTPAAPVVVVFIVVVAVGFAIGMLLTHYDNKYKLTERAAARMKGYELEFERKWPELKQRAINAARLAEHTTVELGHQASRLEQRGEAAAGRLGHAAVAGVYTVDRYFHSAADMAAEDVSRFLGW